jgi:putative hydrolase of the HAD superfamily
VRHFDVITLSAEAGCAKPQPEIFNTTLDALGVAAGDSIFVDDTLEHIEAARGVGMYGLLHVSTSETIRALQRLL